LGQYPIATLANPLVGRELLDHAFGQVLAMHDLL
jgi:hypothetical protein